MCRCESAAYDEVYDAYSLLRYWVNILALFVFWVSAKAEPIG